MGAFPATSSGGSASMEDWEVHTDSSLEADKTITASHDNDGNVTGVFKEISANRGSSSDSWIESLTSDLEQFHIRTPAKEPCRNGGSDWTGPEGQKAQTGSESTTSSFKPVSSLASSVADLGRQLLEDQHTYPLAVESRNLPPAGETLAKHLAGKFEWLLEVPTATSADEVGSPKARVLKVLTAGDDGQEKTLSFGCNLLRKNTQPGIGNKAYDARPANTYTLLATRLRGEELESAKRWLGLISEDSVTESRCTDTDSESSVVIRTDDGAMRLPQTSTFRPYGKHQDTQHIVDLGSAKSPSRIEDSFEALDKLEEEIEAMGAVTEAVPLVSPALTETSKAKDAGLTTKAARAKAAETTASTSSPKKAAVVVSRPASLLPPKALAKSSKQPTKSTFELPGEAIARRLKEQREARRSQSISAEQAAAIAAAYSPSKPHVKSTKPPTRPTFELPGEAISRRKREEHEAKLKAQEEEERKRREFKARPIRAGVTPGSLPRQTLASLARQGKPSDSSTPGSGTVKRLHTGPTSTSRGRLSAQGPPSEAEASRTGSSVTAGGSAVSAENGQPQKLRGRDIYARDNSLSADRQRERRDREAAAWQARQDAADRSRQSGRDWAEKQKQRLKQASGPSAS